MSEHTVSQDEIDSSPEEADSDAPEPFNRRVAIVLALLGVLGAWVGILHNDSGNNESTFARETTRTAVASLRANVNQSTVQGLGVDLDAEQAALGVAQPFRSDTPGDDGFVPGSAESVDAVAAGIDSQDREALERELTVEAERLDLKRQALAETRVTYNNRTSQYETVLTTLAVALFLVGFTLVLTRRTRPPVLVPGLVLAAYVAGWAVWIHQREVPTTSDPAIEAAAQAAMHQSFGEFDLAVDGYTEAIDLDGDFEAAFAGRSVASFLEANPDFGSTLAVVKIDGEEVDEARADADVAIRLAENDSFTGLLLSGIYDFYAGDQAGAIESLDDAIAVNDRAPEAYFVLAAAHLAAGDRPAADVSLDDGLALLDLDEASQRNRQYAADLFTLLEQVEFMEPGEAEDVDDLRKALAAGEARLVFGQDAVGAPAENAAFSLDRSTFADGELTAEISYEALPADSVISLYAYEQPGEGLAFAQAAELARFAPLEGSGSLSGSVPVVRRCQPVAFRYDLYVNGVLASSFDAPGGDPTC